MKKYPTDYRLWAVLFWPPFFALGFLPGRDVDCFWANLRSLILDGADYLTGLVLFQGMNWVVLSAFIGWVLQAVAQCCGVRLRRGPEREDAADYDDTRPPAPGG